MCRRSPRDCRRVWDFGREELLIGRGQIGQLGHHRLSARRGQRHRRCGRWSENDPRHRW